MSHTFPSASIYILTYSLRSPSPLFALLIVDVAFSSHPSPLAPPLVASAATPVLISLWSVIASDLIPPFIPFQSPLSSPYNIQSLSHLSALFSCSENVSTRTAEGLTHIQPRQSKFILTPAIWIFKAKVQKWKIPVALCCHKKKK